MASKFKKYQSLTFRIGSGKEAEDYKARILQAMKIDRRKKRSEWIKFVIDLALERAGIPETPANPGPTSGPLKRPRRKGAQRGQTDALSVGSPRSDPAHT